jgi:hypothetical protein
MFQVGNKGIIVLFQSSSFFHNSWCIRFSLHRLSKNFTDSHGCNTGRTYNSWQAIGDFITSEIGPNLVPQKGLSKGRSVWLTIHLYLAPKLTLYRLLLN